MPDVPSTWTVKTDRAGVNSPGPEQKKFGSLW